MKIKIISFTAAMLLIFSLALAGCGGEGYTVTFDTQGGKRTGGGELKQTVEKGKAAVAPELERSGYIFCDWNDTLTPEGGDKTVSAIWKKTYTVKFNPTGGTVASGETEQLVGEGDAAKAPEVKREGYTFEGWDVDFGSVETNLTVNAKWSGTYLVTFDPNGGTAYGAETVQSVKAGKSATPPETKREGYVFAGWSGAYSNVTKDTRVTAIWSRIHTVTFDLNGGTLTRGALIQQVEDGKSAVAPACYKENTTLTGWSGDFSAVTSDLTLTAQWGAAAYVPTELYKMASQATVEINTYSENGKSNSLGTGFFIDANGTVLTNFHVLAGAFRAEVKLKDGSVSPVMQILGYDISRDLAIVKVAKTGNPCLTMSERGVQTGEKVYTLGSSRGMTGTFSDGMVSTASRTVLGIDCIQISAPISTGNSGGPLLNEFGEVVGVNSLTVASGQNLNFSINIKEFYKVSTASPMSVSQFYSETYLNGNGMFTMILDEIEPNNEIKEAQMVVLGSTTTAKLADAGDRDCFKYITTEAEEINILLIPQDAATDRLVCELTDENGRVLATASKAEPMGNTGAMKLTYKAKEFNTYYIRTFMSPTGDTPLYYIMHIY